jgi:hypothetical protein
MASRDDECTYQVWLSKADLDDIKRQLDPDFLSRAGCRVIKHPDCCVLCAINNDCSRIPLHWNCRCKPEGYLELEIQ